MRLTEIKERINEIGNMFTGDYRYPFIYANQVCGEDEIVFDGFSFATNGHDITLMKGFEEDIRVVFEMTEEFYDIKNDNDDLKTIEEVTNWCLDSTTELSYKATVLGLRDYVAKTGFENVLLGESGGIDSAVVSAIAADALGPDKVWGIMMPYEYTSDESITDALEVCKMLGINHGVIPIVEPVNITKNLLSGVISPFDGKVFDEGEDITEENLQSRQRALILMALSNKFNAMLLSTGNKSEMSVGYATLYGDMCGGYNPIKDAFKLRVFDMARWRNSTTIPDWFKGKQGLVIPENIITKPPSAELRPDQRDTDSLPPYDVLDAILSAYIEDEWAIEKIIKIYGYNKHIVERVVRLVKLSEYKRRQAPPGIKLRKRSFGKGRRYPIANHYKEGNLP